MCYLHSSWQISPFHNRYPQAVHKSDTHHKEIPASLILGLTLAFHAKLPARLFLLGMYLLSTGKCQATPRKSSQQAMHIPVPGSFLSLCAGAAQAGAQLEDGFYSSSSGNQKSISYILECSCHPQALLHKPTLPLHQELTQRPL